MGSRSFEGVHKEPIPDELPVGEYAARDAARGDRSELHGNRGGDRAVRDAAFTVYEELRGGIPHEFSALCSVESHQFAETAIRKYGLLHCCIPV